LFLNCKKGNAIMDTIMFFIVIFVLAMIGLISLKFYTEVNTELQSDADLSADAKKVSGNLHSNFPGILEGIFITAVVLLWILVLVASFLIDAHPVLWGVSMILLIFLVFVGAVLSNTYNDMTTDAEFSIISTELPMTNWLITRLPFVILVIGTSIIMVLFAKVKLIG